MLATAANKGPVLSNGHLDTKDDTVLQVRGDLLELCLKLRDELRLTTQADLIRGLTLAGAR